MATILLDLTLREESTALQNLFSYTDETSVYKDFESLIQGMNTGFQAHFPGPLGTMPEGVTVPNQSVHSAVLAMLAKLTITPEVTALEPDRALLTFHSPSYDLTPCINGVTAWMGVALNSIFPAIDPAFLDDFNSVNGPEKQAAAQQLYYNTEYAFLAELMKSLAPTENEVTVQAAFVPTEMTINGKQQTLWLPEDPTAFGSALVSAVLKDI